MMRIYLALQQYADGRVAFRRWSLDPGPIPGGHFQQQNMDAYSWFLEQAWNFKRFPFWTEDYPGFQTEETMANVEPFELIR